MDLGWLIPYRQTEKTTTRRNGLFVATELRLEGRKHFGGDDFRRFAFGVNDERGALAIERLTLD